MKTEIKKLKNSEIEIDFELSAEEFEKYFQKGLQHVAEHVKVDGFRKGQVPLKMVEEKVKPEELLMEAGDMAVKAVYPKFVEENKLEPIGDPDVQIKKIAKGNEFLFTVKVAVIPGITLPDYKEIASHMKVKDISVDEKELQETLDYLQKSRAKFTDKTEGAQMKDYIKIEYQNDDINGGKAIKDIFILGGSGFLQDFENNLVGMKTGDKKEFTAKFPENAAQNLGGKEGKFNVTMLAVQTMELAELNDEFAKSLGAFDTMAALKENLKEGIGAEKKETEKQRARGEMLENISSKIKFDMPPKMVEFEQDRLLEDLKLQVNNQFNISFEKYLEQVKKTEEEIKANYNLEAQKRIKNFLVLREIGNQEKIEVTEEELAKELEKMMKRYTKEQLAQIDIRQLSEYSKGAIFNEKVFEKLESFSK